MRHDGAREIACGSFCNGFNPQLVVCSPVLGTTRHGFSEQVVR